MIDQTIFDKHPGLIRPFWALATFDTRGRHVYASGTGIAPEEGKYCAYWEVGALFHGVKSARKFESQVEAEAAIESLMPWCHKYVVDELRKRQDCVLPSTFDLKAILVNPMNVYSDGSGEARSYISTAMDRIARQEEAARIARAFIQKWEHTLAGMSWDVWGYLEAEIKIHAHSYRGEYMKDATVVASQFPVKWKREKEKYPREHLLRYDWVAEIDGVILRIGEAEAIRMVPQDDGRDGTVVKLERQVA